MNVREFGAFVELQGYTKHGLVPISHISKHGVENVADVLSVGDSVWVKVISLGLPEGMDDHATEAELKPHMRDIKLTVSLKYVSQSTGEDLDKNEVQLMLDSKPRGAGGHFVRPKMVIDAVLPTVCTKCHGKGHLAFECYGNAAGYELLPNDDDERSATTGNATTAAAAPSARHASTSSTTSSRENDRPKKNSSGRSSGSALPDDITSIEQARALLAQEAERKAKRKRKKEERKRKRDTDRKEGKRHKRHKRHHHHSSSDDDSSGGSGSDR